MDVSRKQQLPRLLAAVLFIYECLRLLVLVVFLFIVPPLEGSTIGAFFPYIAYISANALFPLMALFVWLRPQEYRNYITLYMAGKIIGVVSFFAWVIFGSREFPGAENVARSITLLSGSFTLSLTDAFSVWGARMLKNKKNRKTEVYDANYPDS